MFNKKKIINDPVYGFVTIPSDFIYDIIEHPYFQRLRYIKQVSMTHLVFPGALHTRFQHAIGAMHLMTLAIDTLRSKNINISPEEEEATLAAILLHDIGHGPFSHSLEHTIIEGVSHEYISSILMNKLNEIYDGKLDLAIKIFTNKYSRPFLHQLVSSQLDTDRMDYLIRDSFFTGVSEGVISFDRIIKMLNVFNNELVIEEKGIYSVEKFLIARRLMYWQVYLHKTVISAEQMLIHALRRAKELHALGHHIFVPNALAHFFNHNVTKENFLFEEKHLEYFTKLDDTDVMSSIKAWSEHEDNILNKLCSSLLKRKLYRTRIQKIAFTPEEIEHVRLKTKTHFNLKDSEVDYFVYLQKIENNVYNASNESIKVLSKDGLIKDILEASDFTHLAVLTRPVIKYALTIPKEIDTL